MADVKQVSDIQKVKTIENPNINDASCSDEVIDNAASKLKVCGHPVRLKLLCTILKDDDPCVSELWVCLNQPQPVISQHLAVLKDKGIVKSEVKGNRRIYSIVDPFVKSIILSVQNSVDSL
jgi:DNA-binding transcriptional ArsR family regulator